MRKHTQEEEKMRTFHCAGGGAAINNSGNTTINLTLKFDMRGTTKERFTEKLGQLQETLAAIGVVFPDRSILKFANDKRIDIAFEADHIGEKNT
jgi:hypothetical protein